MSTWEQSINGYLTSMVSGGRSKGTIRLHEFYLRRIRTCAPCPAMVSSQALDHALAVDTWAPETRHSIRTVARGFFAWTHANGITASNPALGLLSVKVPAGCARPAPDKMITRAIHQARAANDHRLELLIRFGAYLGLRCAEIARVHARDWDGELLIVHGKGGKRRALPVADPTLKMALNTATGYLFPGGTEGHLSPGHVSKLLSRGLPDGITGHMLRHRFGTKGYEATRDLLAVGAALGHSKPETTQRYIRLPSDAIVAVVSGASS